MRERRMRKEIIKEGERIKKVKEKINTRRGEEKSQKV